MAGKVHITQITSQRFERQIWPFHGRKVFRYHMKMGHGRPQENEKHLKNALENSISMTPYSTLSALKGLHLSSKFFSFAEKVNPGRKLRPSCK